MSGSVKSLSQTQQGFTLIELLVALTIFAVLAAAGWQVFDQLQKTRERVGAQSERLSELQQAYMQVNRDITQMVSRPVVTSTKQEAALTLSSQKMSFTKLASIDPRFVQTTAFERVSYAVRDDQLIRLVQKRWGNDNEQVVPIVLLDNIADAKFVALDPAPSNIWPSLDSLSQIPSVQQNTLSAANPNGVGVSDNSQDDMLPKNLALMQLPVGIQMSFTLKGMGADMPIQWRFAVPEPAPTVHAPKSEGNAKSGNGNGNEGGSGSENGSQSSIQSGSSTGNTSKQPESNEDEPDR